MAHLFSDVVTKLKISNLTPTVQGMIENFGSPDLRVVGNSQNAVVNHSVPGHVLKLTACLGTIEFLNTMKQKGPISGLPMVIDYLPNCGDEDSLGVTRKLHAFTIKKYSLISESANKDKFDFAEDFSFTLSQQNREDADLSHKVLQYLSAKYQQELRKFNLVDAMDALLDFFNQHKGTKFTLDMTSSDWLLDKDQLVHVDPVVDYEIYEKLCANSPA